MSLMPWGVSYPLCGATLLRLPLLGMPHPLQPAWVDLTLLHCHSAFRWIFLFTCHPSLVPKPASTLVLTTYYGLQPKRGPGLPLCLCFHYSPLLGISSTLSTYSNLPPESPPHELFLIFIPLLSELFSLSAHVIFSTWHMIWLFKFLSFVLTRLFDA